MCSSTSLFRYWRAPFPSSSISGVFLWCLSHSSKLFFFPSLLSNWHLWVPLFGPLYTYCLVPFVEIEANTYSLAPPPPSITKPHPFFFLSSFFTLVWCLLTFFPVSVFLFSFFVGLCLFFRHFFFYESSVHFFCFFPFGGSLCSLLSFCFPLLLPPTLYTVLSCFFPPPPNFFFFLALNLSELKISNFFPPNLFLALAFHLFFFPSSF